MSNLLGHALLSSLLVACASTQTGADTATATASESLALPSCNRSGPASCYIAPAPAERACDALACLKREDPAQLPFPNEGTGPDAPLETILGCEAIQQRSPAPAGARFREVGLLPTHLRDRGEAQGGHESTMLVARDDQGWCLIDSVVSNRIWDGDHWDTSCPCTRTMRWNADVLDLQTECRCASESRAPTRPEVACYKVVYKLADDRFHYQTSSSEEKSCGH